MSKKKQKVIDRCTALFCRATFFLCGLDNKKTSGFLFLLKKMCEPCADNCYGLKEACIDACDPEDWACGFRCEADVLDCLQYDCLKTGLCCDEVCIPRPGIARY
jgi:hypothetical protein